MPAARAAAEVANFNMSLLNVHVHVQLLVKHNYIAYSIIAITQKNPQTIHIRGPTIEMDESPQGPGTKEIRDRPGNSGTVEAYVFLRNAACL